MLPEHKQWLDDYITYKVNYYGFSAASIEQYTDRIGRYLEFVEYLSLTAIEITPDTIIGYRDHLLTRMSDRSATAHLSVISSFYKWMTHPTIQVMERNPFPKFRMSSLMNAYDCWIPTAKEILEMRRYANNTKLLNATAFETMISTGLRISEIRQLRVYDLQFQVECAYDHQLKKASPFVGGYIDMVSQAGLGVKRGMKRRIYFSRLAGKLLQRYIAVQHLADNMPLFPFTRAGVNKWLKEIAKPVVSRYKLGEGKTVHLRRVDFLDTTTITDLPPELANTKEVQAYHRSLEKAKRRQQELEERYPHIKKASRVERVKPISFHNHCTRHAFAMLMMYRNWFGASNDIKTVSLLLGHRVLQNTLIYAGHPGICFSYEDWKRIWLGTGMDYRRFFY